MRDTEFSVWTGTYDQSRIIAPGRCSKDVWLFIIIMPSAPISAAFSRSFSYTAGSSAKFGEVS